MKKSAALSEIPQTPWTAEVDDPGLFVSAYGALDDAAWLDALCDGRAGAPALPAYPDGETMRRIHGAPSLRGAMEEAFAFYRFIRAHPAARGVDWRAARLLDYGCGWGRIHRAFLRETPANRIEAFEPNYAYAVLARRLNPFILVRTGDSLPDGSLPAASYDVIFGWSIFSHLPRRVAVAWLAEFGRIARPGAVIFLTTWGARFIEHMIAEKAARARGAEINWYTGLCIDRAGDLEAMRTGFLAGDFQFIGDKAGVYGEAFVPRAAAQAFLDESRAPIDLVDVDDRALGQDALVLRRRREEEGPP